MFLSIKLSVLAGAHIVCSLISVACEQQFSVGLNVTKE